MSKLNATESLNSNIALLEQKKDQDFNALKHQLRMTGESLKPANIIKSAVKDIAGSKQMKSLLIKAAVGLALGIVAAKVARRKKGGKLSSEIKKSFLNDALQYGMGYITSKRNAWLKAAGMYLATQLIRKIRERRLQRRHLHDGQPVHESELA